MKSRQEKYRSKYKEMKKDWKDSQEIFVGEIKKIIKPDSKILDIGCGHAEFLREILKKTPQTYGIDPDQKALDKNNTIKNKYCCTAEKMPFEDNTFDIIISAWVLEHLENPEKVFKEIHRVLKPGAKVIFLTPNAWNYNIWIIRMIPERFHDFFTRKLYNRQENDTYPKQYKINSPKKVRQILTKTGFKETRIILNGDPSYISFNTPLYYFACLLEKIFDLKPLNFMRVHIIGIFTK